MPLSSVWSYCETGKYLHLLGILNLKLTVIQNTLVRKAIMVNRIHYVKAQYLTFSEDSGSEALKNLQNPLEFPPPLDFLTAIIMNSQIKAALNSLLEDQQKGLIEEFDWELRRKGNDTWAICLCAYLVISLTVEELQVAVDGFAQFKTSKGGDPILIHNYATEICRRLEKNVLEHAWFLLHSKINGLKKRNSFVHGFPAGESNRSKSEVKLIQDLGQIMSDHGN